MDTIIYRYNGGRRSISKVYMREVLHKILSDTTNEFDVYLDEKLELYFVYIAKNKFLIIDATVPINKRIVGDYIIRDRTKSSTDPFGLSFTLKSNRATVRNLADVLFAYAYDRGSVTSIDQLFMFKSEINADAVFTTPLILEAQPQILLNFGPYVHTDGTVQTPTTYTVPNDGTKNLVPWSNIVNQRGSFDDFNVVLSRATEVPPGSGLNALQDRGRISVKRPGVYMINGFIQLSGVSETDDWQEVSLLVNKG